MRILLSSYVTIEDASQMLFKFCNDNFYIKNPEYYSKKRLGIWTGSTPERLYLYERDGNILIVPVGMFTLLKPLIPKDELARAEVKLADEAVCDFGKVDFGLYSYQQQAVEAMYKAGFGILNSRAGSGKTQMGLALAIKCGYRTLWLTHTNDLLEQSYERAALYLSRDRLGKIAGGKVELGDITFATVQTMSKVDLPNYRFKFNTVIVDECHRICGSPAHMGQFAKVLNNIAARHKYGLSATVHRCDGTEKSIIAYVGNIRHRVSNEAVKSKTVNAEVARYDTGIVMDESNYIDFDGTVVWSKYLSSLAAHEGRTFLLARKVKELLSLGRSVLVLSDRIALINNIQRLAGGMILTGRTHTDERKRIIELTRLGKNKLILSTYSLAKEGLDVPRLDTLVMATPVKDYAVVVQAAGRVMRVCEGKQKPLIVDVVDGDLKSRQLFKKRCTHYKKEGLELVC